jgi:hypothetical protein
MKTILILISLFFATSLHAQIIDAAFFDWTIYEAEIEKTGEKKCYMVAHPASSISNHNMRGKPYISITRYQNRRIEEFSLNAGFEIKTNDQVFVMIDDRKFSLISNGEGAWTRSQIEDAIIIQKILNSSMIKIRLDSAIGTYAVDEYSLKGVAKAYNRLRYICD